jgi:hypothetical protein
MLSRLAAWIEAALPLPLIYIEWDASAYRHRAHIHITVIDVPAVGSLGISATG